MQYIVLDLEWNQPLGRMALPSKKTGDRLMFELIQIGAVKLDGERRLIGSFNRHIRPTYYPRLHPRIRRITGISQDDLAVSPRFPDAYRQFLSWCGEDFVLLTWGGDDISILAQNLIFFDFDTSLPPLYDMQPHYSRLCGIPDRHSLRKAMAHFGISPTADHPFHSAVDDAYYTALVFQRFPNADGVLDFPQSPRAIGRAKDQPRLSTDEKKVSTVKNALGSRGAMFPACPVCGKRTTVTEGYVPTSAPNTYMALSDCKTHGLIKCEISFSPEKAGGFTMTRSISLSEEQNPAYVRTKHLQWARKVARLKEKEDV